MWPLRWNMRSRGGLELVIRMAALGGEHPIAGSNNLVDGIEQERWGEARVEENCNCCFHQAAHFTLGGVAIVSVRCDGPRGNGMLGVVRPKLPSKIARVAIGDQTLRIKQSRIGKTMDCAWMICQGVKLVIGRKTETEISNAGLPSCEGFVLGLHAIDTAEGRVRVLEHVKIHVALLVSHRKLSTDVRIHI